MQQIHVSERFNAPASEVFDIVSDHERFLRGFGIDRCVVTTHGREHKNGVGAVREIDSGPLHFVEEVVRFDPPVRYDYRIRRFTLFGRPLPLEHEIGWLELAERDGKTEVDWYSRFRLNLPIVGGFVARRAAKTLGASFENLLEQASST